MLGKTISHYEILEKIGSGGMGEVYRARDTSLERDVALKILPTEIADDPQRTERFQQEAKAVAALSHPNILGIYEFGTDQGRSYAAMELLEGETLSERLRHGPIHPRKAVDIASQIADGLAAAHERGVVHRDLKPDNVFITTEGRVKILDFGLARLESRKPGIDPTASSDTLTEPGAVMGTVGYMSPEQVRGEPVDARSDIFSLGVVLYEVLAGSRPFDGDSAAEVMGAILRDEPTSIREKDKTLPESLDGIVDHCLEKQPSERFQSARDLGFALTNATSTTHPDMTPVELPVGTRGLRRSLPVWAAALLCLAAGLLLGYLFIPHPEPHTPVRLTTLTYSGRDWAPSASPSGDMIAFVSDRDGVSRIWLKHLAGGGEEPITEGPDDLPCFSPDGSQILFVHDTGATQDLYRTSVVGAQPRKILQDVLEADWSPDGARVAFLRMRAVGEDNVISVGVADVQTGDERILTEIENRNCYAIRWSPDGTRLAMSESSLTGMVAGESYIDLIDIDSGDLQRITLTDWAGPYTAIHWAPRGRSLIACQAPYVLARVAGSPGQVMEYDLDSRTRRPLFWAQVQPPMALQHSSGIAVLSEHRIIVDEHAVHARLYEFAWAETGAAQPRVLTSGLGRDRQPAYSPDGDRVIFSSNRGGNVDVWIVDRRTGELQQLTDHPADDFDPAITPDGDHMLWSSNRGGNMEIWMANADGSGARQVTHDGVDAENATMTPDGEWIVHASSNDEKLGIWKIRPDGSEATRLVAGSFLLPEVSPDGRYALFSRVRGVNNVIQVVEIETGEVVLFEIELSAMVIELDVTAGRARWTPDSRAIVYIGEDDEGRTGVFVQDFVPGRDTSESRRPLGGFSKEFVTESHGVSPDGKNIVISAMFDQRCLKLAEYVSLSGWE
jgi:serine/threonine protein kinase/Tol biopolymer transport system component